MATFDCMPAPYVLSLFNGQPQPFNLVSLFSLAGSSERCNQMFKDMKMYCCHKS